MSIKNNIDNTYQREKNGTSDSNAKAEKSGSKTGMKNQPSSYLNDISKEN